ncbi:MAG: YCF48-related protein [Bacteroidota bacterium]|jgi:photosystem II stability/assembly factor-like uncharacterized protein|nr:YCF48-related protein [Bacteroidota bacterium]
MRFSLLLVAMLLTVSQFSIAQLGWFPIRQDGETILYCIDMYDADNITAVGSNGTILHSSDGGTSWATPPSGMNDNLRRIRWHSPSLGIILGLDGTILKSVDGGTSWQPLSLGSSTPMFDIHFFDEQTWLLVGVGGKSMVTTDGGQTWTSRTNGINNFNEISFLGDFGVIVGNKGTIRVTTDGGKNWTDRSAVSNFEMTSVSVGDDSTAIAVGSNGTILRTQNKGRNWTPIIPSVPISFYRLSRVRHLTRERIVLSGYAGLILWSTDTGLSWYGQESNTSVNIETLEFLDSKIGVAAGWDGTIIRTNTGGTLDVRRLDTPAPDQSALRDVWPHPLSRQATAHVRMHLAASGPVTLRVYDLLGRACRTLHAAHTDAGVYTVEWTPSALPSGMYLYRLEQQGRAYTRTFTLVD